MKKEILLQPNNLVKSRYNFTAVENKLFYRILFKAQKQNENKDGYNATLSIDEIKGIIKFKNDTTQENIDNILAIYQQSILQFDYVDEKGQLKTFNGGLTGPAIYNHSTREYEITLHEVLYNHITDFVRLQKDGYTPLNLDVLFKFKGAYTQRFYTLMRLWSREQSEVDVTFTLDEIRSYLKLGNEIYPQYKHFKHNIIKRALKEINEKGNMKVDIKQEIRKGRKVDTIVFSVFDLEPRKYFEKKDIDSLTEDVNKKNKEEIDTVEVLDAENNTNISEVKKETLKIENKGFYIPDESVFAKGTLRRFKLDFENIDFKDNYMKDAFDDSVTITLDRDDVEIIKAASYKFFKGTLENKIEEYKLEEQKDLNYKKEIAKYW
jgi:hypothetical protein